MTNNHENRINRNCVGATKQDCRKCYDRRECPTGIENRSARVKKAVSKIPLVALSAMLLVAVLIVADLGMSMFTSHDSATYAAFRRANPRTRHATTSQAIVWPEFGFDGNGDGHPDPFVRIDLLPSHSSHPNHVHGTGQTVMPTTMSAPPRFASDLLDLTPPGYCLGYDN